ncbi:hypothetical protein [Winogradskyella sp. 3972H.M.0a.05]|uniref:hypothetical protein n=1 Tax=Winogradskyella sp. 3972H.M.0a.05 TaxID=2950277 RepID=UPI0033998132
MNYSKKNLKSLNIKELVDYIKIKYHTIFDYRDIYHLFYFLNGFLMAKIQLQKSEEIDNYFQKYFSTWMSEKFQNQIDHSTSWVKIIDKLYSEEEAVDKFFVFFDDFIKEFDASTIR